MIGVVNTQDTVMPVYVLIGQTKNMKIAVIFEVEANPATEEHCKMIVERFLEGKGVVEKGEDFYGYKEIKEYENSSNNISSECRV